MSQPYHSPHRDHQNQHTEKCSVHTRRCLALQCTLISCSFRSFWSTGLSVTSPHLHSENIFIPLHDSRTTYVFPPVPVCFFWDFCNSSPFCFSQHLPHSPQLSELSPDCSCISGGDSFLSSLDLSLSVQSTLSDCLSGILSWISHSSLM